MCVRAFQAYIKVPLRHRRRREPAGSREERERERARNGQVAVQKFPCAVARSAHFVPLGNEVWQARGDDGERGNVAASMTASPRVLVYVRTALD